MLVGVSPCRPPQLAASSFILALLRKNLFVQFQFADQALDLVDSTGPFTISRKLASLESIPEFRLRRSSVATWFEMRRVAGLLGEWSA
jgi:hypothetical protein